MTIRVLNQNRLPVLIRPIWRVHFFYQHGLTPRRRHQDLGAVFFIQDSVLALQVLKNVLFAELIFLVN